AASECTVFVRTIIKKSDSYDAMQIDRLKIDTQEKYDAITKTINLLYRVNLDEIQLTNPFKFI
ncbi:hypothetical protein DQ806_23400, partial [Salmonella enterica subsp. enterica serovar Okatie]|nr:hypothetical protein [Salmonella enterica subsp. enterica serovar Okatie]